MNAPTNHALSAPILTPEQAAWVADYESAEQPFGLPASHWYAADCLLLRRHPSFLDQRHSAAVNAPPAREPAAPAGEQRLPAQQAPMKKAHG